eukprot:5691137-Karenia_brevis.AAC.1
MEHEGGTIIIYNIHDFDWSADNSRRARMQLLDDIKKSEAQPLSFVVLVIGDLNRMRSGETRTYLDPLDHASYVSDLSIASANVSLENKLWDDALDKLTEICTPFDSHYSVEGKFENRLDRIFWSVQPWLSRQLSVLSP